MYFTAGTVPGTVQQMTVCPGRLCAVPGTLSAEIIGINMAPVCEHTGATLNESPISQSLISQSLRVEIGDYFGCNCPVSIKTMTKGSL